MDDDNFYFWIGNDDGTSWSDGYGSQFCEDDDDDTSGCDDIGSYDEWVRNFISGAKIDRK